ncbi:pentapeptide repeat-containing protein [Methyloterricola oryzae]|uniref:pentapeptide repeat-containing protein n=1 Tax=Methyloterricola oryzae TaxID=1495050 RepID=UPI00069AD612|nr:pentapeptide repeat-containing protein [Methyloterricola oryzae]
MSDAYFYRGLAFEFDQSSSITIAKIDGCRVIGDEASRISAERTERNITRAIEAVIDGREVFNQKRKNAQIEQLNILKQGVPRWNKWRKANPEKRPLLFECDLTKEGLEGQALDEADFSNANLVGADLRGQTLRETNFHESNLARAKLHSADLTRANFCRTDLYETQMPCAILDGANLQGTQMAKTNLTDAHIVGCTLYGLSAWDLQLEGAEQKDLVIRYREPQGGSMRELLVDDLLVAQFLYTLLNNGNLQNVIAETTSKIVLILGRFSDERKQVLEKIRDALKERKGENRYVPIIFDFKPEENRGLTETILLLASLSKFVIADLTDAKSIPQELSHIVPNLPSVPIQPILIESEREYAMFEHWRRFPWVHQVLHYKDKDDLIANLESKVILPAISEIDSLAAARRRIEELEKELSRRQEL